MSRALLALCALLGGASCARILVSVPVPSFSHQAVFRPLARELARRGHQLVVLTTDPGHHGNPNITEIDLHDSYALWTDRVVTKVSGKRDDMYSDMEASLSTLFEILDRQMRLPEVTKLLGNSSERFDLILAEWLTQGLALAHRFRAPVILLTTSGAINELYEFMGLPGASYLYTDFLRTRIYNLTLWEEAKELYFRYRLNQLLSSCYEKENAMFRRVFGGEMPPVGELKHYVELVFVNEHPLWNPLRPTPPGVVHLGGLHLMPPKELPQELKAWMDAAAHGVIYVSFGTNTDPGGLPAARVAVLLRALAALPHAVLWRWRAPPPLPPNVRAAAWLPQPELLRHENLVLFVTQAGLQSTDEALRAGVPLLALPTRADQWFNAEQLVNYGAARCLDLDALSDDSLARTIHELIHDKSYRENSRLLGEAMRDRPQSSLQRAVWWTEHVLRRRGRGLRARSVAAPPRLTPPVLATLALATVSSTLVLLYCIFKCLFKATRKQKVA